MEAKKKSKHFWNWLWNSDSILSYVVLLAIVFVFVKFIFLPILGFIMGTSLPLAIVESSSMDHSYINIGNGNYEICGKVLEEKENLNIEKYWWTCGDWYQENANITFEEFSKFNFKNGFNKGDLMIIIGKSPEKLKIGDVVIFASQGRAHPVIHRIVSLNPISTKGDHNSAQLPEEKSISDNQIVGVAVARIPYIGWIKLFFVELFKGF